MKIHHLFISHSWTFYLPFVGFAISAGLGQLG